MTATTSAAATATTSTTTCQGCHQGFPSRNAVFNHLLETHGACLPADEHAAFVKYVVSSRQREQQKVLILYGYLLEDPPPLLKDRKDNENDNNNNDTSVRRVLKNGEDVAELLLTVLETMQQKQQQQQEQDDDDEECTNGPADANAANAAVDVSPPVEKLSLPPINRSYGYTSHSTEIVAQDDWTGAITEVLATKLLPIAFPTLLQDWIDEVNRQLAVALLEQHKNTATAPQIVVLGRIDLPKGAGASNRFNAEMDWSHRRVEYLLPVDFLFPGSQSQKLASVLLEEEDHGKNNNANAPKMITPLERFFAKFTSFHDGNYTLTWSKTKPSESETKEETVADASNPSSAADVATTIPNIPHTHRFKKRLLQLQQEDDGPTYTGPGVQQDVLLYMHSLKKLMQRLATPVIQLDSSSTSNNKTRTAKPTTNQQNDPNGPKAEASGTTAGAAESTAESNEHQPLRKTNEDNAEEPEDDADSGEKKNDSEGGGAELRRITGTENERTVREEEETVNKDPHQTDHQNENGKKTEKNDEHNNKDSTAPAPENKKKWHDNHQKKKRGGRRQPKRPHQQQGGEMDGVNNKNNSTTKKKNHQLKRKRYHNFTPTVMAHEYLAYRRVDRFYHRATLRFPQSLFLSCSSSSSSLENNNIKHHDEKDEKQQQLSSSSVNTTPSLSLPERPFLLLSMSADLLLTGQALRMVGLFIAIARGSGGYSTSDSGGIDADFIDCVFDEEYPHLVPTPPAPLIGLHAADAIYTKWEGKLNTILSPRPCTNYTKGWNDEATLARVAQWQTTVREHAAQAWLRQGGGDVCEGDENGVLLAEKRWTRDVLQPWAKRAREQLEHYRMWKASKSSATCNQEATETAAPAKVAKLQSDGPSSSDNMDELAIQTLAQRPETIQNQVLLPPLSAIDSTVPSLYEKVLFYLQKADSSGQWPSTTPKRQLVMISTQVKKNDADGSGDEEGEEVAVVASGGDNKRNGNNNSHPVASADVPHSLATAQQEIRNRKAVRASAYVFAEGQGGASGSFSVGAMPGEKCGQPKANALFPELMKAAFELEIALRPNREPSSTIAINRNAQFRPHTDSGAGAGQSTSLIVGLGTYSGGELVVEGEKVDIRYKAIEFNGWKQRHWTMPFLGERYSLVWFTPKGCEGLRGIDLCPN